MGSNPTCQYTQVGEGICLENREVANNGARVRVSLLAHMIQWLSGLKQRFAKPSKVKIFRRFESYLYRHKRTFLIFLLFYNIIYM